MEVVVVTAPSVAAAAATAGMRLRRAPYQDRPRLLRWPGPYSLLFLGEDVLLASFSQLSLGYEIKGPAELLM